jgi:Spy/CpxP family protein refolding chaperone
MEKTAMGKTGMKMTMGMSMAKCNAGLAALVLAGMGAATMLAQGPGGQDVGPGMGPHRPPMERAMGPRGDHGRWWNDQNAIEKFKLTEVQRKSMDDTYQQHRLTLVDLHATLEKAELAMEPLMKDDQPDEGKILAQIDRIAQARAELEKANARMLLGIRKELTPEQWKLIQADRAAHRGGPGAGGPGREGMPRWHGRGGPGAGGPPAPQDGGSGPVPPGEEE